MMTAALAQNAVTEGAGSLEVRWMIPGRLHPTVTAWFGRFPAEIASRQDSYLLDPGLHGLSLKIRGSGALEVKLYQGSPGMLEVAGRARGRMQFWRKWSFPVSPPTTPGTGTPAGWIPVSKRRRIARFWLASRRIVTVGRGLGGEPGCAVELTEARTSGETWWTLGLEATGAADWLPAVLEATAARVFALALPDGMYLGPEDSMSYADWLSAGPASERGTGA